MGHQLSRVRGWEERLQAEVSAAISRPFQWHEHDCCRFAARCVYAITGVDAFAAFERTYATGLQAARVLRRRGGIAGVCDSVLGERRPPRVARRGDVVLAAQGALAVCVGSKAVAPGRYGLRDVAMCEWTISWKVG